jgi:hypothetical protein
MMPGLKFHVLYAEETSNSGTINQEKLYVIYTGFWLRPQEINLKYEKSRNFQSGFYCSLLYSVLDTIL